MENLPAPMMRRDVLIQIERLDVPADAKVLLARLADLTVMVGQRVHAIGRQILSFVFEVVRVFPNTASAKVPEDLEELRTRELNSIGRAASARERMRKANADRVRALMESGRLLAEAEHLRSLIAKVATAVEAGAGEATSEELARWRQWAEQEADKLDPVISGQVRAHLLPPKMG